MVLGGSRYFFAGFLVFWHGFGQLQLLRAGFGKEVTPEWHTGKCSMNLD